MDLIGFVWIYLGLTLLVITACGSAVVIKETWEIVKR
jgi:hypothetical protein